MIEHNLDVIKTADWVVDMGPEGGSGGGMVVAEGTPEEVAVAPGSHTGVFLAERPAGRELAGARTTRTGCGAQAEGRRARRRPRSGQRRARTRRAG